MKTLKIIVVAGARPNFMKVAPLIQQIEAYNANNGNGVQPVEALLVHTGQHYDESMSHVFFRELGIRAPDINLNAGPGSHAQQTAKIMMAFEPVCEREKPDWVVVVGDVNSTLACTLVCSKTGIQVAHVEAGLRSFDRSMPEEINRIVTDSLADLLLTPSEDADENLRNEGVAPRKIERVGNIMIDSLIANLPGARKSNVLQRHQLHPGDYIYVTLHRPANVDTKVSLTAIMAEMNRLSKHLRVIFPVHPRTSKRLGEFGIQPGNGNGLLLSDPIGYHDSLCLTEHARFILTDSGGLQEESTFFKTPCLTLRPNTERPVTIQHGSNRLTNLDHLKQDIDNVLNGPLKLGHLPPLWDGQTARRSLAAILAMSNK